MGHQGQIAWRSGVLAVWWTYSKESAGLLVALWIVTGTPARANRRATDGFVRGGR